MEALEHEVGKEKEVNSLYFSRALDAAITKRAGPYPNVNNLLEGEYSNLLKKYINEFQPEHIKAFETYLKYGGFQNITVDGNFTPDEVTSLRGTIRPRGSGSSAADTIHQFYAYVIFKEKIKAQNAGTDEVAPITANDIRIDEVEHGYDFAARFTVEEYKKFITSDWKIQPAKV